MVASIHGSSIAVDAVGVGQVGGVVELDDLRRLVFECEVDFVDDAGRGGDEVEVVFAGQPLLDDLEVEQAEEAAAEAEAERGAGLHLEAERGVVEAQLVEAVAELLEVGGVDREEAAEHDRLDQLEAGEGLRRRGGLASVMVSPTRVSATSLICAVMKPISPGPSSASCSILGRKQPTRSTRCVVPAAMKLTCCALARSRRR